MDFILRVGAGEASADVPEGEEEKTKDEKENNVNGGIVNFYLSCSHNSI